VALTFVLAAVANAAAFTNDHHVGRHIYAIAAGFSGLGAIYAAISAFGHLSLPYAGMTGLLALLIGVLITWLRPFRVLYA
jgi:hypothetical protein